VTISSLIRVDTGKGLSELSSVSGYMHKFTGFKVVISN
jgi:hypothetical protein